MSNNLKQDIDKFKQIIDMKIVINNSTVNAILEDYNQYQLCNILTNWYTYSNFLNKQYIFQTKYITRIIYCLLTDVNIIKTINNNRIDIDIYDPVLDKFWQFDIITKNKPNIKFKIFNICNNMIVFDCRNDVYNIYRLYDLSKIKELYMSSSVDFDLLLKDIQLEPVIIIDPTNLEKDFKKLSYKNTEDHYLDNLIITVQTLMNKNDKMETKIQKYYKNIYNPIKKKKIEKIDYRNI